MKQFYTRIAICVIPILVAAGLVGAAWNSYRQGQGGFKLGVDLVGGTILIYEVADPSRLPENYKPEELAASLKRRIDPADLYNVTIRPAGPTRVEIILPTGGEHQASKDRETWQHLINEVRQKWPQLQEADLDVGVGQQRDLIIRVDEKLNGPPWNELLQKLEGQWPKLKEAKLNEVPVGRTDLLLERIQKQDVGAAPPEITQFIATNYRPVTPKEIGDFVDAKLPADQQRKLSGEDVERIKKLVAEVGALQFKILANNQDDRDAIRTAQELFKSEAGKAELTKAEKQGTTPPDPRPAQGETWPYRYTWVELGKGERKSLGLDNAAEKVQSPHWQMAANARKQNEPVLLGDYGQTLLFSREIPAARDRTLAEQDRNKRIEYFLLVREPETGKEITGKDLPTAGRTTDQNLKPAVSFRLSTAGAEKFYELTYNNRPKEPEKFGRHLAIILDNQIVSAPTIQSPIRSEGQITGNFTQAEVDRLITILRAGALPATLKPVPVSENTIGPTLGSDTIAAGTKSVGLAFLVVILFMIVYYRFAGLVASIALLANLLLTVAFMVAVQATFTLPGLAGIVLMLGMAVDANVLIYERIREERDRGASLALAIRNGYDRAFGTIIDTHLSSIFTAIVLYAVGNDQLKGFGVSLTVGLVISLFTSLYMTRLLFDIWMYKGWLKKLSMLRFFSRPNIDFMRVRYYWFTATVVLTVLGISLFLIRGKSGLNIDFVGGTAYTGQLVQPATLAGLRQLLDAPDKLRVAKVEEVPGSDELGYVITYAGQEQGSRVNLPNKPAGATREEREQDVARRASQLPDLSIEQIFLSSDEGGQSRLFNVRTSEKAPELVQVVVNRLLQTRDGQGREVSLLKKVNMQVGQVDDKGAILTFVDPATNEPTQASPSQVSRLLEREFKDNDLKERFLLSGLGKNEEGRFGQMRLEFGDPVNKDRLQNALKQTAVAFEARPQPERLENFDTQLAAETQKQALWAILLSWGVILMYLWFRFGNWTFGLAAVLCLVHDLCFTLGIIAACHYLHGTFLGDLLALQDFKIDLPAVAALLTLVGYSVNDTIVVFDRIREIRGKNPELTPQMINDSVNGTLSRTLLASLTTWLVVIVLYIGGGEGVHLFAFVMVVGVIIGTYSSIYVASPLLLMFGEGRSRATVGQRRPEPEPEGALA